MHLSVDIEVQQGKFALQAKFDFYGSSLGIFGPSGSGKSTLIRALAGLVRPDRGRIEIGGQVLFDDLQKEWVMPHERNIGVVFQDARLFPHWSVEKNLCAGVTVPESGLFSFERIIGLLEIQPLLARSVRNLSGGEQQRIALGRALLAHPRLLLMDEPISGLDADLKTQILPFLKRIQDELFLPCVMVSHHLPEILELTDQLLLVEDGLVTSPASVGELIEKKENFERLRKSGLMSTLDLPEGRVGLRPDEVLLASRPVEGLSAQHHIQGTITQMIDHGGLIVCLIETDAGEIMADVTPRAVRQMDLSVGGAVWCIFKSCALHMIRND